MAQASSVSAVRVVSALALLYVFRMLGLFMVFPVMMLYGADYVGATPLLLGLALGGYGLTQAILQLPLGLASDLYGRKLVITLGLAIFALGSVVAATADSVYGLIAGRALQGAGAISGVVLALVGDLTSEANRTRAMAAIGASIGLSFSVAMVLGPVLAAAGGLATIFWLTAALALVGMGVLWGLVPTPTAADGERGAVPQLIVSTLKNRDLQRLDLGILMLHFALTCAFVGVPLLLSERGVAAAVHWHYYLPLMLAAFVLMLPFIYLAERGGHFKRIFLSAIGGLIVAAAGFVLLPGLLGWCVALLLFFVSFNLLEASLPSLVSKQAPAGSKGTAMGVYSTCQFLGTSLGGVVGGYCASRYGVMGPFVAVAVGTALWLLVALRMQPPAKVKNLVVSQPRQVSAAELTAQVPGVVEANWVADQALLYLKIDERFERAALNRYLAEA